jgi:uncharacterized repeat protein (TIGR01451 family)
MIDGQKTRRGWGRRSLLAVAVTFMCLAGGATGVLASGSGFFTDQSAPATGTVSSPYTWTVGVHNHGSGRDESNVTVTDTLPAGVTASSSSPNCSGTATVTCTIASLPDNSDTTETISGAPTSAGQMTNTVDASGITVDSGTTETDTAPEETLTTPVGEAAATGAPVARTGGTADVTDTAASLLAIVNPDGLPTTYGFEYGTTSAYGNSTARHDAGEGTDDDSEAADLTGLPPSTTFHYRVFATNSDGTTLGADRTFTTAAAPPISATTDPPASLGATTATLAGTINPEGRSVTYFFRYGKTTAYEQSTPAQTLGPDSASHAVGADVTGLTPDTTYHYQLVVNDGEAEGADRQLTTGSPASNTGSVSLIGIGQATILGFPTVYTYIAGDVIVNDAPNNHTTVELEFQPVDGNGATYVSPPAPVTVGERDQTIPIPVGDVSGVVDLLGERQYVVHAITGDGAISSPIFYTTPGGLQHPQCLSPNPRANQLTGGGAPAAGVPDFTCDEASLDVIRLTTTAADVQWTIGCPGLLTPCSTIPEAVSAELDYGLSPLYGRGLKASPSSVTVPLSQGQTRQEDFVAFHLTGLKPGTIYHARLSLGNVDGLAGGADVTFVTLSTQAPGAGVVKSGTATLPVACRTSVACTGHIALYAPATPHPAGDAVAATARRIKLGAVTFRIPAHKRGSVHIRLTPAGKRLLRGRKRFTVTELITTRVHNKSASTTRKLTLSIRR